jgi:spore maturation protein CgeB
MKIYIKRPSIQGAWIWIIKGYASAWEETGFEVLYYDLIRNIPTNEEYDLMVRDWDLKDADDLKVIEAARRVYFFPQPNEFPLPWGSHPNFYSQCSDIFINKLNKLDNVYLWSYGTETKHHTKWKEINFIPLAFDSINYKPVYDKKYEFDVCFIGGWANNGFNEKRKIMLEHFGAFKNSGLKCGFFINKGLTHEQENLILCSSKIALNLHDVHQRALVGSDTNERTFKSLGLNGLLVSDNVKHIKELGLNAVLTENPKEMVDAVKEYAFGLSQEEREEIKVKNRQNTLQKHTYLNRIESMLELK